MSAPELAERLWDDAMGRFGDAWDEFDTDAKIEIHTTVQDLATLMARATVGENVELETLEARATLANWSFVGSDRARAVVAEVFVGAAKLLAGLAATFVKGLL